MSSPTRPRDPGTAATEGAPHSDRPRSPGGFDARYGEAALIGRGGMGEVRCVSDERIGREVAVKVIRGDASEEARERFLREARLQGQLEHPAIVPVYDLGTAEDGSPYFTMKQLRGMTLAEVVRRGGEQEIAARFGRRRLLADFVRVAQAIAYAHSKGVIHRDIKPANIMFGDFGEVYVLDWGIARVHDLPEPAGGATTLRVGSSSQTRDGSVLGTLGYMPPEQLEGAQRVDARADVYALGAVLFEILAGETLHAMTDVPSLIQATTEGVDARPGVRAPDRDVPPELDDVCVEATALDPDDRYPDVESLVADVERYLDGDRDRARRRALAQEYAARARERLEAGLDDSATRSAAIRAAGRAVAFDPDNAELAALLSRLILAPPTEIPEQVEARLQADDDAQAIEQARIGASVGLGWLGLVPVLVWMGVRSWTAVAVFVGLMLVLQVLSRGAVALRRSSQLQVRIVATVVFIVIGWSSLVFGPFMMTPALAAMTCGMFMLERDRGGTHRYFLLCAIGTVLVPFVLELTGVLPISGAIREGTLVLFPRVAEFNTLPTLLLLVLSSVSSVYIIGKTIQSVTRMLRETRRQLALHAWHLDQLVPPAPPA